MVQNLADPELQEADGFDADDDESVDEALDELEPQEEGEAADDSPDPLAELRERLDQAVTKDELEAVRNQIRSELGRAQRVEARLDEIAKQNPTADIDPRLAASEEVLTGLTDALIASDLIDDQSRASLRSLRARLDASTSERAQARLRQELLEEVRGAAQPQGQDTTNPWEQASADVVAEAQRLGYDATRIPKAVWDAGVATGRPTLAVRSVLKWVEDQMESADTPTNRVAQRRRAAGRGSPARSGAALSNDDIIERYGAGDPNVTAEQYTKAAAALGLTN